jgi:hypothetical protein
MMIITLMALPLVFMLRKPAGPAASGAAVVVHAD